MSKEFLSINSVKIKFYKRAKQGKGCIEKRCFGNGIRFCASDGNISCSCDEDGESRMVRRWDKREKGANLSTNGSMLLVCGL